MLRTAAVLMVVCLSAGIGVNMAGRLRRRRDALRTACGCISRICLAIRHTNRPLSLILRGLQEPVQLVEMAEAMDGGMEPSVAWAQAEEGLKDCLTRGDMDEIGAFAAALGKSTRASQLALGDMAMEALSERLKEAEQLYLKKGRVYRTMGVLLGAGLAILLL